MRPISLATAILGAAASLASAQQNSYGQCLGESACTYSTTYKGDVVSFNFRRLCRPQQDYIINDQAHGHIFYSQICGTAGQMCNPEGYLSEYNFGSVIQTWGTAPAGVNCVDPRTQELMPCTAPCAVTGLQSTASPAVFSSVVDGDPTQGLRLTLFGETPTRSDPFRCDYDPVSGAPYPRVTQQEFYCDPSVTGFAELYDVSQNATDSCLYTLRYKTSAACVTGGSSLSGGWVFDIIFMVTAVLYLGIGSFLVYRKTGQWDIPNRAFWSQADELVLDGVRFILRGCKKGPHAGGAGKGGMFDENGGALSSPGLKGSPFVGSSYNASGGSESVTVVTTASPKTPGGSGRSGYQAIGTPGQDADL